jgi:hypothetical protein
MKGITRSAQVFVAALLLAVTRVPSALAGEAGPSGSRLTISATGGRPPWAACSLAKRTPQKVIARYSRDFAIPRNGGPAINKGSTTLRCGDKGWGYFHVKTKHYREWSNLSSWSNYQTWMDVAHAGLVKTLADPDKVTYSSRRETFCLSAKINYYRDDQYVTSKIILTILGKDMNIVSTYPSQNDKQCEENSHD